MRLINRNYNKTVFLDQSINNGHLRMHNVFKLYKLLDEPAVSRYEHLLQQIDSEV